MNHRLSALVVAVLLLTGCAGAGAAVDTAATDPTLADELRDLPPGLAGVPVVPTRLDDAWSAAEVSTFSTVDDVPVSVTIRLLPSARGTAGTVTICAAAPGADGTIDDATHEGDEELARPCGDRPGSVHRVVDGIDVVITETDPRSSTDWATEPLTAAWQDQPWVATTSVYPPT